MKINKNMIKEIYTEWDEYCVFSDVKITENIDIRKIMLRLFYKFGNFVHGPIYTTKYF
jgi:hypothetical protein